MPHKPFKTDGASGFISFFYWLLFKQQLPWEELAYAHDFAYWKGGALYLRELADRVLQHGLVLHYGRKALALERDRLYSCKHVGCWARLVWWSLIPDIVYAGVRLGGVYWLPFPSLRPVEEKEAQFKLRDRWWRLEFDGVRWGYGYTWPQYEGE